MLMYTVRPLDNANILSSNGDNLWLWSWLCFPSHPLLSRRMSDLVIFQ